MERSKVVAIVKARSINAAEGMVDSFRSGISARTLSAAGGRTIGGERPCRGYCFAHEHREELARASGRTARACSLGTVLVSKLPPSGTVPDDVTLSARLYEFGVLDQKPTLDLDQGLLE